MALMLETYPLRYAERGRAGVIPNPLRRAHHRRPLLVDFLQMARNQSVEWANVTVSRLSAVVGDSLVEAAMTSR